MRIQERKPNRLEGYDYSSSGWYFVTICTKKRIEWFGKIMGRKMVLNEYGEIVKRCWFDLPHHYGNCLLDKFVVMSNHIHGIIIIKNVGNGFKPFPTPYTLSEIVRGFKTFSSRRINEIVNKNKFQWQKSFYDHIIRDERSLNEIRSYIHHNPLKWEEDEENPKNVKV